MKAKFKQAVVMAKGSVKSSEVMEAKLCVCVYVRLCVCWCRIAKEKSKKVMSSASMDSAVHVGSVCEPLCNFPSVLFIKYDFKSTVTFDSSINTPLENKP